MLRLALAATGFLVATAGSSLANITYTTDFQSGAGPEWSNTSVDNAPLGGQRILGQFSNETVLLKLPSVRAGELVDLAFDFCAIRTWDGNAGGGGPGPDVFNVSVLNGLTLLSSTFSVGDKDSSHRMSYAPNGGGDAKSRAGAFANDSLGYAWRGGVLDATWRMNFLFTAPEDGLILQFAASGLQSIDDESWGLDNVRVTTSAVPAPGPVALVGTGLLIMNRRRR